MWFLVIESVEHDCYDSRKITTVRTVVGKQSKILDRVEKLDLLETAVAYGPLNGDTVLDNFESIS